MRELPSRREFLRRSSSTLAVSWGFGCCNGELFATESNHNSPGGYRQGIAGWRREAADAARDVLLNGGNAVDAGVAALLVLCVIDPANVGLGGYGGDLVLYHARTGTVRAIDSDSRAPRKFIPTTFKEYSANYGYLAVGVPGVLAGIDLALREYGNLQFKTVGQHAVKLAENGIPVSSSLAEAFEELQKVMDPVSRRAYFPNGVPETGHVWVQRDLAKLIRRLGEEGPGSFYTGDIAKRIARQVKANGGVLSEEDFRDFRAHNVRPLHIDYRGYDLYTPTLPAGGLTTLSILKTLEQFDLSKFEPWGARYLELFAGASNLCWKERFEYFGDPDFVNVPIADLLSEKRAIARAEMLRKGIATPVSHSSEPPGTVNFVIIDKDRNMISWTATHGGGFGSHVAIEGLGLMLGHGMSRFAFTAPDPNYPAPGKRPQHNMSPLLVLHGGKPYAALGMPGGRAIVTFTAQMLVNLIDFKAAPQRIVSSPRIHTEGRDPIELSQVPKPVVEELRKMGHKVEQVRYLGGEANAAIIDPKTGDVEAIASGEPPGVLVF